MNNLNLFIMDQYQRNRMAPGQRYDPVKEAQAIYQVSRALGPNSKRYAIVDEHDTRGLTAYQQAQFTTFPMNGDRAERLGELVWQWADDELKDVQNLVLVSADPTFSHLCKAARKAGVNVQVWVPGKEVPRPFREYTYQLLEEVLPGTRVEKLAIHVDYENIHFGLAERDWPTDPKVVVKAIKAAAQNLGEIVGIIAYGDWVVLGRHSPYPFQSDLDQAGVEPRYQRSLKGKNSSDMRIADTVRTQLEGGNVPDVLVIVTGDRDFRPLVETAKARGKKVIIIALRGSLSRELSEIASEVRYLDDYIAPQSTQHDAPQLAAAGLQPDPLTVLTLRIQALFAQHNWRWTTTLEIIKELSLDAAGQELLQKAVTEGVFNRRNQPGATTEGAATLSFNTAHPVARATYHMSTWLPQQLKHYLEVKGLPYVDSAFLARGMAEFDTTFRQMGVGKTRAEAEIWLHMAADAGLVESRQQQHPKNPGLTITTWWLPGSKPATPSTPPATSTQAAPQNNTENTTPTLPKATATPEDKIQSTQPKVTTSGWREVIA